MSDKAATGFDPVKARSDFLIAMYNQMMNDINRHIVVIWQSVGVLFGAFALFALVEKKILTLDLATSVQVLVCIWVVAHVYDAAYWYNRNLVIIANIERQFLYQSDLRDIHYYFGKHREKGTLLTHLRIQLWLAIGVAALVLTFHAFVVLGPVFRCTTSFQIVMLLPWLVAAVGGGVWWWSKDRGDRRYAEFVKNSPGKQVDTTGIDYGVGHPAEQKSTPQLPRSNDEAPGA